MNKGGFLTPLCHHTRFFILQGSIYIQQLMLHSLTVLLDGYDKISAVLFRLVT